jgi:hypothetical protein
VDVATDGGVASFFNFGGDAVGLSQGDLRFGGVQFSGVKLLSVVSLDSKLLLIESELIPRSVVGSTGVLVVFVVTILEAVESSISRVWHPALQVTPDLGSTAL